MFPSVSHPRQPMRLPDVVGDRIGGDHRAVHRQPAASQTGQRSGEPLGRPQHDRRGDGSVRRARPPGGDRGDGRLLVDVDPETRHGVGQPARQPGRLHARAVRIVVGGQHAVELDPFRRLRFRQPLDIDLPTELLVDLVRQPRRLGGVAGDLKGAALDDARVDAFARRDVDHLVDGLVQCPLPGHHPVAAVLAGHPVAVPGNQPRQPAAVAAGRAEPGEPGLQHRDAQRRVRALQVVRRPQAGVAGADDAHVGVAVARQRRTVGRQSVVPVRDATVDRGGHRRFWQADGACRTPGAWWR